MDIKCCHRDMHEDVGVTDAGRRSKEGKEMERDTGRRRGSGRTSWPR